VTGELKVAILGCGPAGLMAAHAGAMLGHDIRILSKPRKSFMHGAQYLHSPIPLASSRDPFIINYRLRGDAGIYREKVYGIDSDLEVSPNSLSEWHEAWDIREAYDWLWTTYGDYVTPWDAEMEGLEEIWENVDVIVSSVPRPLLCRSGTHSFSSASVWATDRAFDLEKDNTVICDGTKDKAWYRSSLIQGWGNTEWPEEKKPPIDEDHLWKVLKPTMHNCDCQPEVFHVGRYGSWDKKQLSHNAYFDTYKMLADKESL